MHGRVIDLDTKKPIANAIVDIWQASSNGKYDFQDPEGQTDMNLRGKFRTNENGEYHYYCLKPTAYSLPTDGKLQLHEVKQNGQSLITIHQAPPAYSSASLTAAPGGPPTST